MKKKLTLALSILTVCVVGRAIADGIPTMQPLTYSGVLESSTGAPVTTAQSMQLTLWDDASANASTNQKCVTPTQSITPDANGRFQIRLDQACFDAVRANPNLWAQLQVGSSVLPRAKLGAVPYAVEAGKAVRTVLTLGSSSTTANGLYCGATAVVNGSFSANGGALAGIRAAKFLCEQSCSSRTAHMCSPGEVTTTFSLGGSPPSGWMNGATGVRANWGSGFGAVNHYDCWGWTTAGWPGPDGLANTGTFWDANANYPVISGCNGTAPILCCD